MSAKLRIRDRTEQKYLKLQIINLYGFTVALEASGPSYVTNKAFGSATS